MASDNPLWRTAANHVLHSSLILKALLEERLQTATGLLLADTEALGHVATDGPLRMSEIADRLILTRGGTTKVIDRLETMGLVARHPDPDDRRATMVAITSSGEAARARAHDTIDAELERMWAIHLSDDEARTLVRVMGRVLEANRRPGDARHP